jgi:hypothetical protein
MENQEFYDRLVKTIRDRHLLELLKNADSDIFSPYDKHFTWEERKKPILKLKSQTISWTSQHLEGLDTFPYFYIMNGNTDSLNTIFSTYKNSFAWKKGDYSYYSHYHKVTQQAFKELDSPDNVDNLVLTWPGYSNGDRTEYNFANDCVAKYKHLDCAYLALTEPDKIDITSFETISISFSKPLSIPYNRIGVLFSKQPIPSLETLNKLGYVNLSGVNLANYLLLNLTPTYWWDKYSSLYDELCNKNNLTPTKCLLFAYKNNVRTGIAPLWNEFLRN